MPDATYATYAIVHVESGMLLGLGATANEAWADAGREAKAAGISLDRGAHECREAAAGMAWRGTSTGGLTVAEEYLVAAATLGRLGGQAKSAAKAAAANENAKRAGRPRYIGCSLAGEIGIKIQGRRATICSNRGGVGRGYMEEGTMAESGATGEEAYRKLASRLGWPDDAIDALWQQNRSKA